MDEAVLYQDLTKIFDGIFKHPVELRPESTAYDIPGWDSFKQVRIILAVEERYGIKFHIREINALNTVGDLVQVVSSKARR